MEIKVTITDSVLNYINTKAMMHGLMLNEYIAMVLTDSVPKETVKLDDYVKMLKASPKFKDLNIDVELSKAHSWILANPHRKLTKKFFMNWINRAMTNQNNESLPSQNIDVERIFARVIELAAKGVASLPENAPDYVRKTVRDCGGMTAFGRMTQTQLKQIKNRFISTLLKEYNEHKQRNSNGTIGTRA